MGPKSLIETDPFSRLACQERSFSAAFATFGSKGPTLCVDAGIGVDMKGEMWRDMILTGEAERNMAKGQKRSTWFSTLAAPGFLGCDKSCLRIFRSLPDHNPCLYHGRRQMSFLSAEKSSVRLKCLSPPNQNRS